MILLNAEFIVTVEQDSGDLYKIYMSDGRILTMNKEMYDEHFEEYEEEDEVSDRYKVKNQRL